jgi:predicted metal-binding protein
MSPFPVTELIVCTTCRPVGTSRDEPAAGARLLEAVQSVQSADASGQWSDVRVRGMACMNSCSRACTVAFQAPGKHSYLFGDLTPSAGLAEQVLACARLHADSPDGTLVRNERPEGLRNGILAKLPPPLEVALT